MAKIIPIKAGTQSRWISGKPVHFAGRKMIHVGLATPSIANARSTAKQLESFGYYVVITRLKTPPGLEWEYDYVVWRNDK